MRYRTLSPTGDYVFGVAANEFLIDSPAAVAQAVLTSFKLFQGEWFLDNTQGMPWLQKVIGTGTAPLYDTAIRTYALSIFGVSSIISYSSVRTSARQLIVTMNLNTIYGATGDIVIPINLPIGFGEGGS